MKRQPDREENVFGSLYFIHMGTISVEVYAFNMIRDTLITHGTLSTS